MCLDEENYSYKNGVIMKYALMLGLMLLATSSYAEGLELTPPLRENGKVLKIDWFKARLICPGGPTGLPTARQLADDARARGAQVLDIADYSRMKQEGQDVSDYSPIYKAGYDYEIDFYYSNRNYVPQFGELGEHIYWSRSQYPINKEFSAEHPGHYSVYTFGVYRGEIVGRSREESSAYSVRCVQSHE